MSRIPTNMKIIRECFGYNQLEVASALGYNKDRYNKYENGKLQTREEQLIKLSNFYKIPAQLFLVNLRELENSIYSYNKPNTIPLAYISIFHDLYNACKVRFEKQYENLKKSQEEYCKNLNIEFFETEEIKISYNRYLQEKENLYEVRRHLYKLLGKTLID